MAGSWNGLYYYGDDTKETVTAEAGTSSSSAGTAMTRCPAPAATTISTAASAATPWTAGSATIG
jgi:hypothetical protein